MMGFMRFSLLLLLIFGSHTMRVQADTGHLTPVSVEGLPARSHLVSHITTLRLENAAEIPFDGAMPSLPASVVSPPVELPLYAGPSATFPTGSSIPAETKLLVRSVLADSSWVEVEGDGQRGWIPTEMLALEGGEVRAYVP